MLIKTTAVTAIFLLAACGYESEYERQVYDYNPVYCYQSIGSVQCYKEPKHSDERRMVNYYGPAPSRYDREDKPETPELQPPAEIDHWVKDPEPVVGAAPAAQSASKPETAAQPASKPETAAAPAANKESASHKESAVQSDSGQYQPNIGFWESIRRGVFGKPQLANTPKATDPTGTL